MVQLLWVADGTQPGWTRRERCHDDPGDDKRTG
jgi:hypothetical protein